MICEAIHQGLVGVGLLVLIGIGVVISILHQPIGSEYSDLDKKPRSKN